MAFQYQRGIGHPVSASPAHWGGKSASLADFTILTKLG